MTTRPTALRLGTAALALPLALTLAACGGDDDTAVDRPERAAASPSTPATPATPASSTSAGGVTATGTPAGDDAALLAAAATAAGAVPGGTLLSLDRETDGWDAEVVDADGTAFDLTVSADGTGVTREPVEDRDDADDADDRAERTTLAGSAVDAAGAVAAARGAVPSGTVTGLDLDLDAGTAVWEVQLDEDTADERTVVVDAAGGEVLRTEQDD